MIDGKPYRMIAVASFLAVLCSGVCSAQDRNDPFGRKNDPFGNRNDRFGRKTRDFNFNDDARRNARNRNVNDFNGPNNVSDEEGALALGVLLIFYIVGFAIAITIAILILMVLYKALGRVPPEFREMEPGQVFLLLIPCFGVIWLFFVTQRIPRSFQRYFEAYGIYDYGDCGATIGLWWAICSVIPYCGALPSLILMIIFLVKISELKNKIPEHQAAW